MNAQRMAPGQSVGRVAIGSGAQGQAWRDAVDRILAAWLWAGIEGAGVWEAVMANAPRAAGVTGIRGVDRAMTSGGSPSAVGDPDGTDLRRGRSWASARAMVGERAGAPRE